MPNSDPNPPLPSGDSTYVAAGQQDTGSYLPVEGVGTGTPLPAVHCDELLPELDGHPRYQVLGLIGAGGMGCVYKARHHFMDRLVALKVINHHLVDQLAMAARFLQEMKAAARLDHPNIVRAYDADQVGGLLFLVMEYVTGVNLDQALGDHGQMAISVACDYARQAALGLQHAYERGMVHRDIKPHNLMLTDEGRVKILDFGLARYVSEAAAARSTAFHLGAASRDECSNNEDMALAGSRQSGLVSYYGTAGTPD